MAQIWRAILLASAMATNMRGLRAIMRASHELSGIALRPIQFNRDMAPMISICRMSAWPAFVTRPSRSLPPDENRSEEHTSELQSLMRISYALFCLKKKKNITYIQEIHAITNNNTTY